MSQMKELLDREAHRIEADTRALDSVYRTGERRQRNRRIGTIISALAIFAAAVAFVAGALGSARSVPADRTPIGVLHSNGDIVVRALVGEREGAILQIDPATSEEVALPVAASAKDLVWPGTGTGAFTDLSSSPDGTTLAYVWSKDVWVLDIASGGSRKIVDSCGPGCMLAWSPDGSVIAFTHGDTLELVNPDGGDRTIVTTLGGIQLLSWSPDSQRIALRWGDQLYTIDRGGSDLQPLGVSAWA
ncbi:MAG: hypothetical protein M3P43_15200, partial [Actinomycetota bacterium]|nr:hypothetical protein [Actinomycetota bacterium]